MGQAIAGDEGALDPVEEETSAVHVRTDAMSGRVVDGWLLEHDGASKVDGGGLVLAPCAQYVLITLFVNGRAAMLRVPTEAMKHVLRVQEREATAANDAAGVSAFEAELGCMLESERA